MKILILGTTGNIGTQTLKALNKNHELVGISFFNNLKLAKTIIKKYQLKYYYSPVFLKESTTKSYDELIKKTKPDLVVNAISGFNGLQATIACLNAKKKIALANKESLVMAGKFIKTIAKKNDVKIYPIDSEHASIYETIKNYPDNSINQIIITCSGGSFYHTQDEDLKKIKYQDAIKHPNWDMGNKISIDSSTLINKCFELVEAYWLFNCKKVKALYHPQSIVHSIIEFKNHMYMSLWSKPNMLLAIQLALNEFKNIDKALIEPIDFNKLNLEFQEIDCKKWKPIQWAYEIINDQNNNLGIIINVANEIAIEKFKYGEIKFNEIISYIQNNIKKYSKFKIKNINQIQSLIDLILQNEKNINKN